MAKEADWTFGIIDDNQNLIIIRSSYHLISHPSDVYMQFIKAGYNVTDKMILNFKWLGIEWDYVQLITEEEDDDFGLCVEGLRLFKRSPYLNAFHVASSCVKNDMLLKDNFYGHESYSNNPIKYYYKFDVHYDKEGCQYNIIVDIIQFYESLYSNYTIYTKNGRVYVKYKRKD